MLKVVAAGCYRLFVNETSSGFFAVELILYTILSARYRNHRSRHLQVDFRIYGWVGGESSGIKFVDIDFLGGNASCTGEEKQSASWSTILTSVPCQAVSVLFLVMSSTAFILAPSPEASLLPGASLNLLPFSLGSNSNPYQSTSTPIHHYFHSRPCPPDHPSLAAGTPLATFRGRQLIGQDVPVPKGYRGLMISAGKRPDKGGLEQRRDISTSNKATQGSKTGKNGASERSPLTPAPSATSVGGSEEIDNANAGRRSTRSSAVRGAGQVALSKPKTRQVPKRAMSKKRIRLDSDDEEGDEGRDTVSPIPAQAPMRTPSKRTRKALGQVGTPMTPISNPDLPSIVVLQPTPSKILDGQVEVVEDPDVESGSSQASDNGEAQRNALPFIPEEIVPSPATEDDPPKFDISAVKEEQSATTEVEVKHEEDEKPLEENSMEAYSTDIEESGNVRLLRPSSSFRHITLWTPDVPLPGYKETEGMAVEGQDAAPAEAEDESGVSVKKGWWRTGGAGEGGDEFVRGMGEWLGLTEMVSWHGSSTGDLGLICLSSTSRCI